MFVKLSDPDEGRPPGRYRVRILHDATNRIVSYPDGRTRYFGSEDDAEAWIVEARRNPQAAESMLRTWKP